MASLNANPAVSGLSGYFVRAFRFAVRHRPQDLIWVRSLRSGRWTGQTFLNEYAWVVMVSGFRVKVVQSRWPAINKAFLRFIPSRVVESRRRVRADALQVIYHERKVDAILAAAGLVTDLPRPIGELVQEMTGSEFVKWISAWPYMGSANRLFLARNLGFRGFAKPDLHLLALSRRFGYNGNVERMCYDLSRRFDLDQSEIDIVLWRYRSEGEPFEESGQLAWPQDPQNCHP